MVIGKRLQRGPFLKLVECDFYGDGFHFAAHSRWQFANNVLTEWFFLLKLIPLEVFLFKAENISIEFFYNF